MIDLLTAAARLQTFVGQSLADRIAALEAALENSDGSACGSLLERHAVSIELLASAVSMKRAAAQIDVAIHAVGILLAVPQLLAPNERIEYMSLGAGNTGRAFDLETTERIAEFKFIQWQGGSESIRQNAIFKDFFLLAEHETAKRRYLYVVGTKYPLKFLNGRRAIRSVLSRNVKLWAAFEERFDRQFATVGDYYAARRDRVTIEDISPILGGLFQVDQA